MYAASSPVPSAGTPSFPANPPFTDATSRDGDGSSADASFLDPPGTGNVYYLVVDESESGLAGPSGHYGDF